MPIFAIKRKDFAPREVAQLFLGWSGPSGGGCMKRKNAIRQVF
jgi:hypothetical protein